MMMYPRIFTSPIAVDDSDPAASCYLTRAISDEPELSESGYTIPIQHNDLILVGPNVVF